MANILDYVLWRGDLSFEESPFSEVDALILCQLSYLDFAGLLDDSFDNRVLLSTLAEKFRTADDFDKRSDLGAMINKNTVKLLLSAAGSIRYSHVYASGFSCISDEEKEEQFSAITFTVARHVHFVAFRGTDDTIVGWKEDFNLATMDEVPAQRDAAEYLARAMKRLWGHFLVGGHSKGGNLAVYAAASAPPRQKRRILQVLNMDGPGFPDEKLATEPFREILPRVASYYPRLSIVGMIFNSTGNYTVVESDQTGIMQHDPFSWQLEGPRFKETDGFDPASVYFKETFNTWISQLEKPQRERFIETMFSIISATDAKTNSEISKNFLGSAAKMAGAYLSLKSDEREVMEKSVSLLFEIAYKKAPPLSELLKADARKPGDV